MEEQILQKTYFKNNSKIKKPIALIVISMIAGVILEILARTQPEGAWGFLFLALIVGVVFYLGIIRLVKQLKYSFKIKVLIFIGVVVFTQILSLIKELFLDSLF